MLLLLLVGIVVVSGGLLSSGCQWMRRASVYEIVCMNGRGITDRGKLPEL